MNKTASNQAVIKSPREIGLVLEGSVCDVDFYPDGPRTVAEAKKAGQCMCPHFSKCMQGFDQKGGWLCVMKFGQQVGQNVLKQGGTVHAEVYGDFNDMLKDCESPQGFVFSADRREFFFLTDKGEVLRRVEEFAAQVLGVRPDEKPPQAVGPNFEDAMRHAAGPEGIDLRKLDQLEGRFAHLPGHGRRCDVQKGPCACGGWH